MASGDENMEKPVAAVEFGSKKIKLVVGYELDGQVYVIYALTKNYGHIVESGAFTDAQRITSSVKELSAISDSSAKIKLKISEALLALPPYGLEVYHSTQITTVISDESKVSNLDIRNIYALFRNGANTLKNELVDIIPQSFILDRGRSFVSPPMGQVSSTITMDANVHTLPKRILYDYQRSLTDGDMNVKRVVVAPSAAAQLIASSGTMPADYILVDIGSNITTVSFVGQNQLYASRFFEWGGDRITERIIERFNINESEAEKIKITYGIDKREMNFKAPVCRTDDGNGNEIKHYAEELNEITKTELEVFVKQLDAAIDDLLSPYDKAYKQFPMILIGGGSRLSGLVEYLEPKVTSEKVYTFVPRTMGARNATFTNCLGMILANAKFPNVYDENHPRVGQVTRDPVK